jgi:hypothetical protein
VYEFVPGSVAALAGDLLTSCQCRKTILADSEKARQYDPAEARASESHKSDSVQFRNVIEMTYCARDHTPLVPNVR